MQMLVLMLSNCEKQNKTKKTPVYYVFLIAYLKANYSKQLAASEINNGFFSFPENKNSFLIAVRYSFHALF